MTLAAGTPHSSQISSRSVPSTEPEGLMSHSRRDGIPSLSSRPVAHVLVAISTICEVVAIEYSVGILPVGI